jgi:hypothetical protein
VRGAIAVQPATAINPFIRIKGYIARPTLSTRRAAMLCLLSVIGAVDARAQDVIEWSPGERLAVQDFRGRPPANAGSASLSWLNIEAEWECQAGALFATARATFIPSRSWWRGSQRFASIASRRSSSPRADRSVMQLDMQLLEHEQLHFDIAELAARKLRTRFDVFKDACEGEDSERIREMVAGVDRELHGEQQRYDRETKHGTDPRAQDQWRKRIRALLNKK